MNFLNICALFGAIFTISSQASVMNAKVVRLIPGETRFEETLVLLSNGNVLRSTDSKMLDAIEKASAENSSFTFAENNQQIIAAVPTAANRHNPILDQYVDYYLPSFSVDSQSTDIRYTDASFIPTNLKSMNDAQRLMSPLQYNEKSRSECYQRAHLWAIEMFKMANVNSQKVFLFFSTKYMREYRFGWWFHVAPFVLVNNKEYVVDQSFFDAPADMQSWTNFFMPSHPICKVVSDYRDYDQHQEEEYCFLRKLPMYYFEPTEVENRDVNKTMITEWINDQVSSAYASLANAPWWKR